MRCRCVWDLKTPSMVTCPQCKNIYVEWVNALTVIEWLRANVKCYQK